MAPKAAAKVARGAQRAGKEAQKKSGGGGLGGIAIAGVATIAGLALVLGGGSGGDAPKQAAKQVQTCLDRRTSLAAQNVDFEAFPCLREPA